MEQLAHSQPLSTPPEALGHPPHWNDHFLEQSDQPAVFREGVDQAANQAAAEQHMVTVWEQEQALLELAVAKIEGRDSTTASEDLARLGITRKAATRSSNLVLELYGRMGAANDMERSDLLLTGLAGLVVEEAATETISGFGAEYESRDNPIDRSFAMINAFTSRIAEQPELVEGRESELLLTAELLGEALRSPDSIRNKLGAVAGIDAESLNTDFYEKSIVQICDAVIAQATLKIATSTEGLSSRKLKEHDKNLGYVQTAILTKYDALFDALEVGPSSATGEEARQVLSAFIAESTAVMDQRELGYTYELFAPIMFRYVALQAGVLDHTRVWHSPVRSDLPADRLGYKPDHTKSEGPDHVAQHIKKQSSDIQVGRVTQAPDSTYRQFGQVTQRLQLKARADAGNVTKEYDETLVDLHAEDIVELLTYLDGQLREVDSVYTALPDGYDHKNPGKENVRVDVTEQVLRGLVREVARRVNSPAAEPNHDFVVKGISTEMQVDIPRLLDEIVLPTYQRLVQDTAGQRIELEQPLVALAR